jgi:hypothetical protein
MGMSCAAPWSRTTRLALLGIAPPTNKSESGNPTARRRLVMASATGVVAPAEKPIDFDDLLMDIVSQR